MEPYRKVNRVLTCLMVLSFLALLGCVDSANSSRSKADDDFIHALTYHHDFAVSAMIDKYYEDNEIDKRIVTERVSQDTNYWPPLCFAAFVDNREGLQKLVNSGAKVNYKDGNGMTPLILASITGNIEGIRILLQNGANINETDINKFSALIHASSEGNIETVKYLVANGSDLGAKSGTLNALDFATFHHHQEVARYLEDKGLMRSR